MTKDIIFTDSRFKKLFRLYRPEKDKSATHISILFTKCSQSNASVIPISFKMAVCTDANPA